MVSYLPPLYNLSIFNSAFFNYQDDSLNLETTDARYLKKTLTDTTTAVQTSLNSGVLELGSSATTSSNTISGMVVTIASGITNFYINKHIRLGYTPSSGSTSFMGYIAPSVGTALAMTSTIYNSLRTQSLLAGNWCICCQYNLLATSAGTISAGSFGVSTSNAVIAPLTINSIQSFHNNHIYALNDTANFQICFPYQSTATGNIYFFSQITFATGTFTIQAAATFMRVA